MKDLTKRERRYHRIMESKYLVLTLLGPPGTAKSAIIKSIADKLDARFIDLRLATMDETDLGVYPYLRDATGYKVNSHAVPEWADSTKDGKLTIIVFEELNRASKSVRDAALGVLLERRIGYNFVFGDNVLMCATGNLGTDDGTEVEEFDTALKSRLVTINHDIPLDEWIESYAKENIHPDIIRYLSSQPTHFYPEIKKQDGEGRVIVNPRTWTGLSKFIERHYGMTSTVKEYGEELREVAKDYIGAYGAQFLRWLNDNLRITIQDVLSGKVTKFTDKKGNPLYERDNLNEVCSDLKAIGILNVDVPQMKNIINLLNAVDDDVKYGSIWDFLQSNDHGEGTKQTDASRLFVKEYRKILETLVKKNKEVNVTTTK